MSKFVQSHFLSQWLIIQIFGSILFAIITQAIVTFIVLLFQIDDLVVISIMRLLACLLSSTIQGYLQWRILLKTIKTLNHEWIYTAIVFRRIRHCK